MGTPCDPILSVIVPCLNEHDRLPVFLRSLGRQVIAKWGISNKRFVVYPERRSFFELVVVDGGSTDGSREIVDNFESESWFPIVKLVNFDRRLGRVRNLGAHVARADLLFFTNSDAVMTYPLFLHHIVTEFRVRENLAALAGRTIPLDSGAVSLAAHAGFDLLRWMFNKAGVFSPSANFLAVRKQVFQDAGEFPEVAVNEDGLLGSRISRVARQSGLKTRFDLAYSAGHYAKRFRKGSFKTLLFYSYVLGNLNPMLRWFLKPMQRKSSREFMEK